MQKDELLRDTIAETQPSGGINEAVAPTRVYYDTPTGEPISLTEDEFNNLVELFRMLAAVRDRNKAPK